MYAFILEDHHQTSVSLIQICLEIKARGCLLIIYMQAQNIQYNMHLPVYLFVGTSSVESSSELESSIINNQYSVNIGQYNTCIYIMQSVIPSVSSFCFFEGPTCDKRIIICVSQQTYLLPGFCGPFRLLLFGFETACAQRHNNYSACMYNYNSTHGILLQSNTYFYASRRSRINMVKLTVCVSLCLSVCVFQLVAM